MGNSRFYSALAALLFAAVCAYTAAALFEAPEKAQALPGTEAAGAALCRQELVMLGNGSYYVAFLPEAAAPELNSCRLRFDSSENAFSAEITFCLHRGAVFHIADENNNLPRGFCRAELIY